MSLFKLPNFAASLSKTKDYSNAKVSFRQPKRFISTTDFIDTKKIITSDEEAREKKRYDHKVIHTDEAEPIMTEENSAPQMITNIHGAGNPELEMESQAPPFSKLLDEVERKKSGNPLRK